jgi:hypothetical protein
MSNTILRWSLSVVLGGGAALLLLHGGHAGVPAAVAMAIAIVELLGAVLFLFPATQRPGAFALLGSLAAAAAAHAVIGEIPPPSFIVFVAAIVVVMRSAR